MKALKIELEGTATSFRYPHFQIGRQPTYRMPPPATIYGHIASVLGEFPNPTSLRFAYHFTYLGRGDDLEHIHQAVVAKPNQKGRNLDITVAPLPREILLRPRLTLYLDGPDLETLRRAFRQPRYTVLLGRSQDLAAYRRVEVVELQRATQAYFENTLLPFDYRRRTAAGVTVNMPLFINPADRREVVWERYIVLERALTPAQMLVWEGEDEGCWVDPEAPERRGLSRAVVWHGFTKQAA